MIWNRNCRKTRHLLALSAGNDFEERPSLETQRHLAVCPHCREVWQRLRDSQRLLERLSVARFEGESPAVSDGPQGPVRPSVWNGMVQHLRLIDKQAATPDWRGWLPSAALAAACVAIVLATIPDPQFGGRMAEIRRPLVVLPQPASVGPHGSFQRGEGAGWDRDLPEVGSDSVRLLPGDDEPRSF